jgi:hypothetical protein
VILVGWGQMESKQTVASYRLGSLPRVAAKVAGQLTVKGSRRIYCQTRPSRTQILV